METALTPFISAYYVLKILKENGSEGYPTIALTRDGSAVLTLSPKDFGKLKSLAEQLMKSTLWGNDTLGNYLLISEDGLKEGNRG